MLDEAVVVEGFHSLLKASLAQARAEGLLSDDELARADADVQIAAPALALFFAALQARGASIAMPDGSFALDEGNCPPSLRPYFDVWARTIAPIQALPLEARHDLALLLCEKAAQSSPARADVVRRLKADLQLCAMEILQRGSFQQRFGWDLQHALDASLRDGRSSGESARSTTTYEPPPGYEAGPASTSHAHNHPQEKLLPPAPRPPPLPPRGRSNNSLSAASSSSRPASPLPAPSDTLTLIRETLFSALGDCMATNRPLAALVAEGQRSKEGYGARSFFAALSLAILDVALERIDLSSAAGVPSASPGAGVRVRAVQVGEHDERPTIDAASCPPHLLPLLGALGGVARAVQALARQDDELAMRDAEQGLATADGSAAIGRVRARLLGALEGVQAQHAEVADEQVAGAALAINKLAIAMFEIPTLRARLAEALQVLAAVHTL